MSGLTLVYLFTPFPIITPKKTKSCKKATSRWWENWFLNLNIAINEKYSFIFGKI